MEIYNLKKYNFDCSYNNYYFISDNAMLQLYQSLNYDLVFYVNMYQNILKTVNFEIKSDEFPEIYSLINKMLVNIKNENSSDYNRLFEKGYFSWKSDAPANEEEITKKSFIYNYFNIVESDDAYILEFVNNINKHRFSVEVNTDRSRYGSIRFDVYNLFKDLNDVCSIIDLDGLKNKEKQLKLSLLK